MAGFLAMVRQSLDDSELFLDDEVLARFAGILADDVERLALRIEREL